MENIENRSKRLLAIFNQVFKSNYSSLNIARSGVEQWDSMKHVELIILIQKEFKKSFNVQDVLEIKSYEEFLSLL